MRRMLAVAVAGAATLGATLPNVVGNPVAAAPPTLRELAAARGIRIGTAITSAPTLADPTYADTLAREFSMAVSENHMKWSLVHPGAATYDYADPDAQVGFAEANAMEFRGHTLAWHNQNPPWLLAGPFTRDERIQQLRDHVHEVVGHYAGRIAEWDVVNEAFDGLVDPAGDPWSDELGYPDYLDIAFTAAHEADPAAKLFYNDYLIDAPGQKFDAVLELVTGLVARGVPIHGVGFQTHQGSRACDPSCANALLANMLRVDALGLDVAITELDVAIALPVTPEKLAEQASVYRSVMQACLLAPNCHTFMMWGFTDLHSWIPSFRPGYGAGLPFDEQYQPKPAYFALADTLAAPLVGPSCASFTMRPAAQAVFDSGVLGAPLLDPDGNGVACEALPAAVVVPVVQPAFTG